MRQDILRDSVNELCPRDDGIKLKGLHYSLICWCCLQYMIVLFIGELRYTSLVIKSNRLIRLIFSNSLL
jgi:hypothetical protein